MKKGFAQAVAVIAKLRFGDGEFLPDVSTFRGIAAAQTVEGIQDGAGP